MKKYALIFIALIFFGEIASAQSFFNNRYNRRFLVTGGGGFAKYLGDLNSPGDFFDPKLNINAGLSFAVSPQLHLRAEYQYVRLAGSDAEGQAVPQRNLSFKNNGSEVSLVGVYHIIRSGTRYYQRPPVQPYVFAGVGLLFHSPRAEYQGKNYYLRRRRTEGVRYSRAALAVPVGGGVKFTVNPSFNVGIEVGYRKTFTDYIDDVSSIYVDPSTFEDPIALALADRSVELGFEPRPAGGKRGNPDRKDAYLVYSLKVEYFLPTEILSLNKLRNRPPGANRKKPRRRR